MQNTAGNREEQLKQFYKKERLEAIHQLLNMLNKEKKIDIIRKFERSEIFKSMNRLIFLRVLYRREGIRDMAIQSHFYQFITEKFLPAQYLNFNDWYQFKMQEKTGN
jgi:hypothetical protein